MKDAVVKVSPTHDPFIYVVRGQKVMLDKDLAKIYGVSTSRLNEQVKRNKKKFPSHFMFQLTTKEHGILMSQFATSSSKWGGRRKTPSAFTEHGAVMLATVLNSPRATKAAIRVVEAFVRLREIIQTNKELAQKLNELEKKYDKQFAVVFNAIRGLINPSVKVQKKIGAKK